MRRPRRRPSRRRKRVLPPRRLAFSASKASSATTSVVTSNETIASVFAKAAATLCQTTADGYGVYTAQAIKVSVAGLPTMEATVARDGRGGGRRFLCARLLLRLERPRRRRHRQCRGVGRVLGLAYDHGRRLKQGRRSSSSVGAASRLPSQQGRTRDLESLSLAPRILVYLVQDSGAPIHVGGSAFPGAAVAPRIAMR